jgi:putative ABC transport system substrate-binding protein
MRTTFLLLIVVLLTCAQAPAGAQQPRKVPEIGIIGQAYPRSPILQSFRHGLRELGYVEGQNIILDPRPRGVISQFHNFAADFVRLKVDVIVALGPEAIGAAKAATKTIPIVATFRDDPVRLGQVASLERPGGNVTGVSGLTLELGGKWLELVKETIPSVKRVAVFWNRIAEEKFPLWRSLDSAARSLGVELQWLHAGEGGYGWLNENLRKAEWRQADAFIVLPGFSSARNVKDIADYGLRNRLPGIFWRSDLDLDQIGGLMAYGANRYEQSRRAAYVVDKILKGAKPAELPVELPKSFELVINRKVANELGITIPPQMLAWADHVFR